MFWHLLNEEWIKLSTCKNNHWLQPHIQHTYLNKPCMTMSHWSYLITCRALICVSLSAALPFILFGNSDYLKVIRLWPHSTDWHYIAHITPRCSPAQKKSFRLSNLWTVRVHRARAFVYTDVSSSCHAPLCACERLSVLTIGTRGGEVRMILWPILPQPNPFLTVLVDPNGPTWGGWCEGDALPWHRYRLHRQTVAWEPGLLLLGAFRETPHSSEGKPIKEQRSMWLTLLNEQGHEVSLSTHTFICTWMCMQGHECMEIFSFFLSSRQFTQQYIQGLLKYISNISHYTEKTMRYVFTF